MTAANPVEVFLVGGGASGAGAGGAVAATMNVNLTGDNITIEVGSAGTYSNGGDTTVTISNTMLKAGGGDYCRMVL